MRYSRVVLALFLLATFIVFGQKTTIDLESFDELKVYDQINVTLVKSSKNEAIITGDETDDVSIVNKDGRLKIRMEIDDILEGNQTYVTLYHTEDLGLIDVNEGAEISSEESQNSKFLTLRAQEGGKLNLEVNSRNLDSKSVTGGKIEISGTTTNQDVMVRTGGEYHAKNLNSNQADVTIFAGGKAFITASEFVEAQVTAGGNIEVFGNPEKIEKDDTLGGTITVHN